jgi:hypothetical protein
MRNSCFARQVFLPFPAAKSVVIFFCFFFVSSNISNQGKFSINTHKRTTMFTLAKIIFCVLKLSRKNGILHVNRFFFLSLTSFLNDVEGGTFINLFGYTAHDRVTTRQEEPKKNKLKEEEEAKKKISKIKELDDLCPPARPSVHIPYLPRSSGACDMCYCFSLLLLQEAREREKLIVLLCASIERCTQFERKNKNRD